MTTEHNNKTINEVFVSLYSRFGAIDFFENETIDEAINQLKSGSDQGLIMEIAVIETSTKKMVWFSDFLGESECQQRVDEFVKNNLNI